MGNQVTFQVSYLTSPSSEEINRVDLSLRPVVLIMNQLCIFSTTCVVYSLSCWVKARVVERERERDGSSRKMLAGDRTSCKFRILSLYIFNINFQLFFISEFVLPCVQFFLSICFLLYADAQGVGKSTLIMRVFETLKASNPNLKIQGFYTSKFSNKICLFGLCFLI